MLRTSELNARSQLRLRQLRQRTVTTLHVVALAPLTCFKSYVDRSLRRQRSLSCRCRDQPLFQSTQYFQELRRFTNLSRIPPHICKRLLQFVQLKCRELRQKFWTRYRSICLNIQDKAFCKSFILCILHNQLRLITAYLLKHQFMSIKITNKELKLSKKNQSKKLRRRLAKRSILSRKSNKVRLLCLIKRLKQLLASCKNKLLRGVEAAHLNLFAVKLKILNQKL